MESLHPLDRMRVASVPFVVHPVAARNGLPGTLSVTSVIGGCRQPARSGDGALGFCVKRFMCRAERPRTRETLARAGVGHDALARMPTVVIKLTSARIVPRPAIRRPVIHSVSAAARAPQRRRSVACPNQPRFATSFGVGKPAAIRPLNQKGQ